MKLVIVTYMAILISAFYAGAADAPADDGEEGTTIIDAETAAKLAMVVSYHAEYAAASGFGVKIYSRTGRSLVYSSELTSLDGKEKYYSITLYRGETEPKNAGEIGEAVARWADTAATYTEKTGENTYNWAVPPSESMQIWLLLYGRMEESREYYSCVVPGSTSQGFLFDFHRGFSAYIYMQELARRILAGDLGVDLSEVTVIGATPDFDFFFEVSGEEFLVHMPKTPLEIPVEIFRGDAIAEYIKSGDAMEVTIPTTDVDEKANREDISVWLGYVDLIEERFGFDPGPGITADSVNAVLLGHYVPTLFKEAAKFKGTILDPLSDKNTED